MTWDLILRICVAALLGGLIGLEREYRSKGAGFRTHCLVAMGSALFMVISEFGFEEALSRYTGTSFDPSRIASQVVTGIGFIGAGCIIFQKHSVRGLTTAAGLWVTSAIGLACGCGLYAIAGACTLLSLLSLEAFNSWLQHVGAKSLTVTFSATSRHSVREAIAAVRNEGIEVGTYHLQKKQTEEGHLYVVTMEVHVRRSRFDENMLDLLGDFNGVTIERVE